MVKPAAKVKPFRFENLEQLSRKQVQLQEGILRYLPQALPAEVFQDRITEQLKKYMRSNVHLEMTALREPLFGKYCATIPDPAVLFVFSCEPLEQKAILQVDFALAHIMVDRMLGGKGEYPEDMRSISPIEEGVLQFLVLKILKILSEAVEGSEIQFRLDQILTEPDPLRTLGDKKDIMALLSIQVTIGKKAGFVRLALPHPLVDGLMTNLAAYERVIRESDLKRLSKIVDVKIPIWIEMGHLDIRPQDFSKLEQGDVVLLDQVFVKIGEQGVTGSVQLKVHDGVGGGFRGNILNSSEDLIEVEIQDVF